MTPIRAEIHRLATSITPLDPEEKRHIDFVRGWIESGAEIFRTAKPATPDPHLVSYFILVDEAENKFLLTDHKKSGLWLPAGGHVEPNEHPQETVRREVLEELGIQADFVVDKPVFLTVTKTVGPTAGHTDVSFWYVLRGRVSDILNYDQGEFHKIQWFSVESAPFERTDPHLSRLIKKLSSLGLIHIKQ